MATPIQTAFEVAQHSVDLLKLGQGLWFASGNGGGRMRGSSRAGCDKAGQPVGEHRAGRGQIRCPPRRNRLALEAGDVGELDTQWMIGAAKQDSSDERGSFLQASTACAGVDLAVRVSVNDLNLPLKHIVLFASGHRVHQLMTDELGDGGGRPQLLLEFERRQPGRSLPDEIDRQEPVCKRGSVSWKTLMNSETRWRWGWLTMKTRLAFIANLFFNPVPKRVLVE